MAYPRFIRNFNGFLDGVSYFGLLREGKLPDVKIMTAAHRGAGMDGPIGVDMGLEGMTAEMTFAEWPTTVLSMLGTLQRFVFRPAGKGDDGVEQVNIFTCSGLITAPELGSLKAGDESLLKLSMDVRQTRLEQDGTIVWDIDLETGKRVIGGIDQNAGIRTAMGL